MQILKRLPSLPKEGGEHHATWLELFFDLVFVLAVSQLADYLHEHLTLDGLLGFAGLFVVIWWAWLGFTFFSDQFDPDHVSYRLVMLFIMLCSIMLAVNIKGAFSDHATTFILLYAILQALLTGLYFWGRRDQEARSWATQFALGFTIATILWLASLWTATPIRYLLWGLALLIEITTPLLVALKMKKRPLYVSHIPERLGLFTMIVLGELIVHIGSGLSETTWQLSIAITAIASFVIAACLWWLYFDRVDANVIQRSLVEQPGSSRELLRSFIWSYAHVLIFAGLAVTSVGITLAIEQAAGQFSYAAALTMGLGCALTLLIITFVHQIGPTPLQKGELTTRLSAIGLFILLAFVGNKLGSALVTILLALTLILVTLIEVSFFVRKRRAPG